MDNFEQLLFSRLCTSMIPRRALLLQLLHVTSFLLTEYPCRETVDVSGVTKLRQFLGLS